MQMAKKVLAVFLAALFVLPGLGALYMPACAQDGVEIIIVPDKTVAAPGETVTYTVSIGPVSYLKTGSIILQVPEGLTFVPFSESELNELNGKLANVFTNAGPVYYENSTRSVVFNSQGYSSSEPTELMQFRCTVADNASGELTVGIDGGLAFTFNKYYDLAFPTYDPSKSAVTIRVPEVSFYVPEAVYLKTGDKGTQWYLNSCGDNGVRPPAPKDTTGKLFFHCDGATDIRITSDGAVVNLITTGTDTIADNDFQIVSDKGGRVTYTATYMAGGMTRTAKAYTYIYMPNRVPTGCATEAESKKHDGNYDYLGFLTALWGAQSSDTKENTSDTDGADVADESIYLGNHGLVKSQNHKPRKSGMVSAGNGTFGAHNNNDINLSVTSPTAYFFVDTSRFTNMKDIPNMYVGLTMTDDEHTDYSKFTTYLAAGHTSGQTKPACIAPIIPETQENGERVIRQEGECTIDYDVSTLQSTETDFTVFTYGYSYCDTGSGYETNSYQHTHFQIRACNKNDLRVLYRDEMQNNYFRQKSFYESADDWARYEAYMEEAAIVLGSPDVRPDSIRNCCNNLSEAIDGFKAKAPSITRTKTAREGVNGYRVYAQVETNGGAPIERVQFPTWTDKNGQDDIQKNWETNSAAFGTFGAWSVDGQQYNYMYYVDVSDHNNEYAGYNTHVYAYNVAGASAHAEADKVNFDYTVRFEGCGATGGSVAAQTVIYGESVTLPSVEREGYMFLGWAETANADAPQYQSGKTFKPSKDTTLYAVWGVAAPSGAIHLVTDGKADYITGAQTSSVWFGNYMQSSADSKEPVKWRVLENKDGKLFLLSDQNLDVFEYNKEYTSVTWETCDMRSWLNGYGASANSGGNDYTGDSFKGDAFSAAEFAAVADSELENADNLKWSTSGGANTTDKVFLLSFADATNTAYGFLNKVDSTDTRKATNTAYTAGGGKTGSDNMSADGKTDHWWLRTPGSYSVCAVDISDSGFIHEYGLTVSSDDVPVRPALNIDLGKVLFTSPAVGGKPGGGLTAVESYDGDDWKLTVLDDSRSGFTAFCTKDEGGVRTIKYSGAKTGENEKISAMIVDADGIVTYYGVLCDAEAGQNTITLNVSGKLGDGDKLYVFNEQANGDYKTDYASALVDVTTSVISYTATFKADGKVVGTVYFTAGTASIKDMEPAVPAKTGHTGKWPAYTLGAEDITIEAVYTPNTYTATAVADGQVLAKIPFTYGQKSVQLPEIPKKEGYTAAWPSYTLGDRDITITAVYTPIQYTATFVADGEVVGTELFIVTQESVREPAVPEKEGYTGAWAPYVLGAKNITIEAVYTPITYTVYWIVDGKTTSVSVPFGSAIEKPADPQKDGYTFTGWDAAIPATMPAHDLTFTAQFEKIAVTLTGLTVKKAPDKTVYTYRNDKSLDLAGLELEATYSDGSTQAVDPSACSITGYSAKPRGDKTITVEYEGQTAQFKVTVKYVWWQWLILIFLLGFIWY